LLKLSPAFATCTYGAGGSARRTTLKIAGKLQQEVGIETAAHLSCAGMIRDQISAFLTGVREHGISNIVAIRGDAPQGETIFTPTPGGFKYAKELVEFIKTDGEFDVAVAGYPEGHPESPDKFVDWQRCREKIEAGADLIITQLFYDNNDYFEFEDYLKNKLGVTVPIVPGILPIMDLNQIQRLCGICKAKLPAGIKKRLEDLQDDKEGSRRYGVELATEMCDQLIRHGVAGLHFYTINRSDSTGEVMHNLSLAGDQRQTD